MSGTGPGEGQRVDGTLFETAAHMMNYWVTYADLFDKDPDPLGASHPSWGLYDVFQMDGGWLFIGVTTERHWPKFCEAAGLADLQEDPRFEMPADRRENKVELTEVVQERIRSRDQTKLRDALIDVGVPAVNQPSDLLDDSGLETANLLGKFQFDSDGGNQGLQTVLAPVSGHRSGPRSHRSEPLYTRVTIWGHEREGHSNQQSEGAELRRRGMA